MCILLMLNFRVVKAFVVAIQDIKLNVYMIINVFVEVRSSSKKMKLVLCRDRDPKPYPEPIITWTVQL